MKIDIKKLVDFIILYSYNLVLLKTSSFTLSGFDYTYFLVFKVITSDY